MPTGMDRMMAPGATNGGNALVNKQPGDIAVFFATIMAQIVDPAGMVDQFLKGNRQDLADKENRDIAFWEVYLPAQASEAEVAKLINEAIATSGAASMKDMGKVVAILKPKLQGRADMAKVSAAVKARLAG